MKHSKKEIDPSYIYNPSAVGVHNGNLFGVPLSWEKMPIVMIPVPWEATTSWGRGTAQAPNAVLTVSSQADNFDPDLVDSWRFVAGLQPVDPRFVKWNKQASPAAQTYIQKLENGELSEDSRAAYRYLKKVNAIGQDVQDLICEKTTQILDMGKIPAVLGGDHSCSFGIIGGIAQKGTKFGILHFDAHMDLRNCYEGFNHSHASVMRNVMEFEQVVQLTQVGIRDVCQEEHLFAKENSNKISVYGDQEIKRRLFKGETFESICKEIAESLPENVYISFDVDGLKPHLCPSTGTPVPGGLEYEQALFLIETVARSGRTIIGFDLVETGVKEGSDYDASVTARLIFRISMLIAKNQKNHASLF